MFRQRGGTRLIVLRDSTAAAAAIRTALDSADPVDIPGLRRALELMVLAQGTDSELLKEWTLHRLREAEVDPQDGLAAVRALRKAEPGLDLKTAVDLVKDVASR
ncbi:hypothetical protein ACH4E7_09805 [Kitasatospora sp. NPDC018058]|uniref:hypothetical protein n=1 Tax=Kitasatospora sp. NPDC018058 TaxID=3364025 RepID=UPI0037C0597F